MLLTFWIKGCVKLTVKYKYTANIKKVVSK